MSLRKFVLILAALVLTATSQFLGAHRTDAITLVVTRTDDPPPNGCLAGDCSLREAIIAANAAPGVDVIALGARVYVLSIPGSDEDVAATGDLDVTEDLNIAGVSAANTVIDANGIDRALENHDGIALELTDVTISGGQAQGSRPQGGAIYNRGILDLDRTVLTVNSANGGGAIYSTLNNLGGLEQLNVRNSELFGNVSTGGGGAIYSSSLWEVQTSSLHHNESSQEGGAIAALTPGSVVSSLITQNTSGSGGSAIDSSNDLVLRETTLSENQGGYAALRVYGNNDVIVLQSLIANNGDSGIESDSSLAVENSTISGNAGSSLRAYDPAKVRYSTLANNSDALYAPDVTVEIQAVIFNNLDSPTECIANISSLGYSISRDGSCDLSAVGDQPNTDSRLLPLDDNGGLSHTHALRADSPARDAADDPNCPSSDQRGVARPVDGTGDGLAACDIGAFEAVDPIGGSVTLNVEALRSPPSDWRPASLVLVFGSAAGALILAYVIRRRLRPA